MWLLNCLIFTNVNVRGKLITAEQFIGIRQKVSSRNVRFIFFSIFMHCSCNRNHYDIIYIMIAIFLETTATMPRYGRTFQLFI